MPFWLQFFFFLTIAGVGYVLLGRLHSIDEALWQGRRIIGKRLEIYDRIAPDLNRIYCFRRLVGYWKDVSPTDLIETKRRLDKEVNIYRHLMTEHFYARYNEFLRLTFLTFTGQGEDAKIRAVIVHELGDRRKHAHYSWDAAYGPMFDDVDLPTDHQIDAAYLDAMNALKACIGLRDTDKPKGGPSIRTLLKGRPGAEE